jgi:RNA polymerase primary sigma factor
LGEIVPDEKSVNPLERLQSKSLVGDVNQVLAMLEPREADIIRLRFGLDGRDPLTLEEVGGQIGITRERVRQLQEQALRDLRKKMSKFEKQRTLEEVEMEKQQAEKAKILQDLLHKDISGLTNHPFPVRQS